MMRTTSWVVLTTIVCLAFAVVNLSASGKSETDEIRIGVIGPMKYIYGKSHWNGAVMAAEEINAAGGIQVGLKRMSIRLVKADSNEITSVKSAVTAMQALESREVHFVLGGVSSEATLAMQDVAMDHKTIFFSCGAAHPELCDRVVRNYERYKYYFRGSPYSSEYVIKTLMCFIRSVASVMTQQLAIDQLKIGILAEDSMWADPVIETVKGKLPKMGIQWGGVWRVSSNAADLSSELAEIKNRKCHILLTLLNGPAGAALGRQYGELKTPTMVTGILSQANTLKWPKATEGMGDYVMSGTSYVQGAAYNDLTESFVNAYLERFGDLPKIASNTYNMIKYVIKPALEKVKSLDPDKLVPYLESSIIKNPSGTIAFERDEMGRHRHDLKWGPGYTTGMAGQWQDGKFVAVWPHFKWRSPRWDIAEDAPEQPNEMSYSGIQPIVIPPWVVETYGAREGGTGSQAGAQVHRIPVPQKAEASQE